MVLLKTITVFVFGVFVLNTNVFCKELPVRLIVNGNEISDAKFYLIIGQKGYLLPYSNHKLNLPDTLRTPYYILFVYDTFHCFISPYSDTQYVAIYFDNRMFHNLRRKKSAGSWFKPKYLFKRKYLIIYGNGMESRTFQSQNNYSRRYDIPK